MGTSELSGGLWHQETVYIEGAFIVQKKDEGLIWGMEYLLNIRLHVGM